MHDLKSRGSVGSFCKACDSNPHIGLSYQDSFESQNSLGSEKDWKESRYLPCEGRRESSDSVSATRTTRSFVKSNSIEYGSNSSYLLQNRNQSSSLNDFDRICLNGRELEPRHSMEKLVSSKKEFSTHNPNRPHKSKGPSRPATQAKTELVCIDKKCDCRKSVTARDILHEYVDDDCRLDYEKMYDKEYCIYNRSTDSCDGTFDRKRNLKIIKETSDIPIDRYLNKSEEIRKQMKWKKHDPCNHGATQFNDITLHQNSKAPTYYLKSNYDSNYIIQSGNCYTYPQTHSKGHKNLPPYPPHSVGLKQMQRECSFTALDEEPEHCDYRHSSRFKEDNRLYRAKSNDFIQNKVYNRSAFGSRKIKSDQVIPSTVYEDREVASSVAIDRENQRAAISKKINHSNSKESNSNTFPSAKRNSQNVIHTRQPKPGIPSKLSNMSLGEKSSFSTTNGPVLKRVDRDNHDHCSEIETNCESSNINSPEKYKREIEERYDPRYIGDNGYNLKNVSKSEFKIPCYVSNLECSMRGNSGMWACCGGGIMPGGTGGAEVLAEAVTDYADEESSGKGSARKGQFSENSGLVGLRNIGNTCFLNSIVQCLSNTRCLLEYLTKEGYASDINGSSGMKGDLIRAFSSLIGEMWTEGEANRALNTGPFKSQIQKFAPAFSGYQQHDAQEFLRKLLEGLHEDVNRVTVRPKAILSDIDDDMSDDKKAMEAWKRYLRFDDSKIVDMFVGQLKSSLQCSVCSHTSVTFDPFWDLSLPIPSKSQNVKLHQCLDLFTKEEIMDGDERPTCSKCKERRKMTKSFSIQKFPKILVLHLKRFSPTERWRGKLSGTVEFPIEQLDLSRYASSTSSYSTYNLNGVANHSGTTYSGHYTGFCKHPYSGEWNEYNDSRVSSMNQKRICSPEAYVLFYELSTSTSSKL